MKTVLTRHSIVRDKSDLERPRKIYVELGLQDGRTTVLITSYVLTSKDCEGWKPIKTFKEKTLFMDQIHINYNLAYYIFNGCINPVEVGMFQKTAELFLATEKQKQR